MLWLQTPPWGRWLAASLIALLAIWIEVRPDTRVAHPFAIETIHVGEPITDANTEERRVPAGLFELPAPAGVATREIPAGAPVLGTDSGPAGSAVPGGWWIVTVDVPISASPGNRVQIVLLDSGQVVEGIVASASSDDGFAVSSGGVAVPPADATAVAVASAVGRIAVLISTG